MKFLLASALVAVTALTSVPAFAQQVVPGAAAAAAHFNQDSDGQNDRTVISADDLEHATLSTRSGSVGAVYGHFNSDADSQDEVRGQVGATSYSGRPSFGDGVFAVIDAE